MAVNKSRGRGEDIPSSASTSISVPVPISIQPVLFLVSLSNKTPDFLYTLKEEKEETR